jgi:diguanylate cyclase (GGDEF)-like protein
MSSILDDHISKRPLILAGAVAVLLFGCVAAVIPFSSQALPVIPPFMPMFATTVCLVEGLTAYFLAVQFRASREPFLGALAGAYGFVMVTAAMQLLIFPNVFAPTGLFGAGPQSAIWVWVIWHTGYPVFIGAALVIRRAQNFHGPDGWLRNISLMLMIGGPILAIMLAYLAVAGGGALPQLITGTSYKALRESPAGAAVIIANITALAACIGFTRLRDLLTLWVAVALLASLGDCVLALAAASRFSLGWYTGRLLSVISSSVVLCVLILEFSRIYARLVKANVVLAERALHDGLTGAFNRFYLTEQVPREIRRASRDKKPLTLLMIDVDHFKSYNDMHGHQAGDHCLAGIAAAIETILRRPGDFVARYGGEEFAAVLPGTNATDALHIADTLRDAVKARAFRRDHTCDATVTISIGIATFEPATGTLTPEDLIHRADQALYQAKHKGRDRALVFEAA